MSPIGQVDAITLDCPDPQSLATFYRTVTGWGTVFDTHEYVYLAGEGSLPVGFRRVEGQEQPSWPSPAAQAHLGLSDPDLARAEALTLAPGAARARPLPREQT